MTSRLPATMLLSAAAFALAGAKARPFVTVVPIAGAPIAREVTAILEIDGVEVEKGGSFSAPATPRLPLDAAKACTQEGHGLAFRLDFPGAIRTLVECEEKLGPALSRPEGVGALSGILVELAAASVAAGERERARSAFARLARLADAPPPDPTVHPPEVISLWEEVRRVPEGKAAVQVDGTPPWTKIWIDGRALSAGNKVPLSPGSHFATAEAPGFAPWSGALVVEAGASRVTVRLAPLEPEARDESIRNGAGWLLGPDDPGVIDALTEAFGGPVLLVSATEGILLLPADASRGLGARVGGRWTAVPGGDGAKLMARGAGKTLASGKSGKPGGNERTKKALLYSGGALVVGALAAGAAVALQPRTVAGEKKGTVTWDP